MLSHRREQHSDLPAPAGDERGDFGALGQRHADTVDRHVLDLVDAVRDPEPPIYGGRSALRADDPAGYDNPARIGAAAGYDEVSITGLRELSAVGAKIRKTVAELLPLRRARGAPIGAGTKRAMPVRSKSCRTI